jgi:hypothetical protein
MPDNARAQFAQQLGQIMEEHRNGAAEVADKATQEQPEADDAQEQTEESEAETEQTRDDGVAELEQAKEELKEDANDPADVAAWKREQIRKVDRALQKNARARKSIADPDVTRKAQAYDLLMHDQDLAQAVLGKGQNGQRQVGPSDFDSEIAAIRDEYGSEPEAEKGFNNLVRLIRAVTGKDSVPLIQAVHGLAGRTIDGDWAKLEEKYGPDISEWHDATFATAKRLGIPLKKALLLESDGEVVAMERQVSDKTKQKKSLTTPTQGGAAGSYSRPKPKAGGTTREDRVKSFVQGVRKQGIELPWNRFGISK